MTPGFSDKNKLKTGKFSQFYVKIALKKVAAHKTCTKLTL
jgi:hypothetical protein